MINTIHSFIPQGAERVMMTTGGIFGGVFSWAFGDVGPLLLWLVVFAIADFFCGTYAAIRRGEWSSHINFMGVAKKFTMFVIVALAHGLDQLFAPLIHFQIFQSITICAYAAGEFGSIIENLERGGLGGAVPPVLRRIVRTLNDGIEQKADQALSKSGFNPKEKE